MFPGFRHPLVGLGLGKQQDVASLSPESERVKWCIWKPRIGSSYSANDETSLPLVLSKQRGDVFLHRPLLCEYHNHTTESNDLERKFENDDSKS